MIDKEKYDRYFDKSTDSVLYERILRSTVEPSHASGVEKLESWLPRYGLKNYLRTYYDEELDAFRQEALGGQWQDKMIEVIETLTMEPLEGEPHHLVNTNKEATEDIVFDEDQFKWVVVDWVTTVTKSIDEPFELTNAFPVDGNLLCDKIVWQKKGKTGEKVTMRYGWNVYKPKDVE